MFRVWFQGVAAPAFDAFSTPLGALAVDRETLGSLVAHHPEFIVLSEAHSREHCLEVQLPFLQAICEHVLIVPLLFGEVDTRRIGEILFNALGPEDLIVVSSDLSHYHSYQQDVLGNIPPR